MEPDTLATPTPTDTPPDLSALLIGLLKGVLYREQDERLWANLLNLQARVRDYATVLNLELVLDEAEGYAFLKSRPEPDEDDSSPRLPRLIARRPLSFPVSLMLALLRRKLAESDANGDETRVIMTRDELIDLVRVFTPEGTNEARQIDQIETTLNKVVELGFLHKLKPAAGSTAQPANYEVKRILKAFVDAQWLADFDARLASYKETLSTGAHASSAALRKNTPQEAP